MQILYAYQGITKNYQSLQIVNNDGLPAFGIYTSGSVLSAQVWQGQNQASLFSPTVAWQTTPVGGGSQTGYDQGQFSCSFVGSNTATLDPSGEYFVLVSQTTNGVKSAVWEGRLKILATPGSTNPAPPDLITYDFAESYCASLGLTDTQRDILPFIVTGASGAARRFCQGRNFDQRTYTEFHNVALNGQVRLFQPPVQNITRVQGAPQLALTISNTSAQNAQAYFAFSGTWDGYGSNAQTATGITLVSVTNGTPASSTVSFVANQTIVALTTLINAVGGGWTALADSVLGLWPVTELDGGYVAQGCGMGASPSTGARFNILQDIAPNIFSLDTRRMGILTTGRQYGYSAASQWGPGGDQMFGDGQGSQLGRCKITYVGGDATIPMQVQVAVAELCKFNLSKMTTDLILETETAQEYEYKLSLEMIAAIPKHVAQALSPYMIPRA